jgi:hypothetical protein
MEIYLSKRKILAGVLAFLALGGLGLLLAGLSGAGSGRSAALAGAEAFYSINYQDGPDVWAARLCAASTRPACEFYQKTVAPYLWPEFEARRSVITAETGGAILLADEIAEAKPGTPMQVWQINVTLSAPWPQGDGRTAFPAHVLVAREEAGWKFERFLLPEEAAKYTGGNQ